MPYTLKKVKNGYKVCKKADTNECFSKKGLTKEKATKQMKAIIVNESDDDLEGGLKPITARIGGKVLLKKRIVDKYFPKSDTYDTYVEPFVGGGSIYFYKEKDNHKEVINDIDPDIYIMFKGLKDYPAKKIAEDINGDYTKKEFEDIKDSVPRDTYHTFLRTYLLYKLSYFGRGLSFGKPRVNSSFIGYQDRLADATILKEDYKEVIKKYNTPNTFFYLDPPVTESRGKFGKTDINELAEIVKTIKGKFLLSLADTSIKKELFKDYKIVTIPTKYVGEKTKGGQSKKVKEYLIMNYEPRMTGSGMKIEKDNIVIPRKEFIKEHEKLTKFFTKEAKDQGEELKKVKKCGGCMGACGGSMVKFHKQLKEVGLNHDKYMTKAKELAKASGYDPEKLTMSEDENHKLCYEGVCFGKIDYYDYIIYSWLESQGEIAKGTADKRRKAYRARATKIKGEWKKDKNSPNNLAINILW